ncbi:MAG TPA: glycoside hydrolase family 15 protein [Chloroflexota bacterium]|nr:glycoside hydrolase family 15 protein [Chloroflexota bacterium]
MGGSQFPPIGSFGFISDCHVNALVAPSGSVEWMCLPRPDSPSLFGAILDRAAGSFRLGPSHVMVPAARRYLPGTLALETTWRTRTGWLIVVDSLSMAPWYHQNDRSHHHRRPPTDYDAEHILLRTVRCLSGAVELTLDCEPVFDYGRSPATWEYEGPGYGCAVARAENIGFQLRLTTDLRVGFEGRRASALRTLKEGETAFVALSWGDVPPPQTCEDATARSDRTAGYWRDWLSQGNFLDHAWRPILERSALVLKGLTYAPTGAMLAAATTSLPEHPGGERNWDYRYSWIRDSAFMLWALYTMGFEREANDFFYFVADVSEEAELQVMYGVEGERQLDEQTLDHLSGYEYARPVRVGNAAYAQQQHDVWGTVLDAVYLHTRSRDYLPERVWPILKRQVESAIGCWREPDRGIWEVRGEPKHFTSSKVMCWVAADRGAWLARLHGEADIAAVWEAAASEMHADICQHGVNEQGVFTQHYDTSTALDASALLMPMFRFLPVDDPRIVNTVLAIADGLSVDGLLLRYRSDQTDDGLAGDEGAFTICSFWLVSALVEIGQIDRARELCEKLLSYASPLGLYAEEIDPKTGRQLGNFPQAFTHLALINAVMHVIRAEEAISRQSRPGQD